ncbi:GD15326 [Drosophila simulans]|uniref:GD15326 n=1 Tax=Drosophila simulans TaxID=7240 RepID=B4NS23_DROSI|nr:GD15326 [Drosophila simulans]
MESNYGNSSSGDTKTTEPPDTAQLDGTAQCATTTRPFHLDVGYAAFTVPSRCFFNWKLMPFSVHSAPATCQRSLDIVIGPDMESHALAYLDDIIVIGSTLQERVRNTARCSDGLGKPTGTSASSSNGAFDILDP